MRGNPRFVARTIVAWVGFLKRWRIFQYGIQPMRRCETHPFSNAWRSLSHPMPQGSRSATIYSSLPVAGQLLNVPLAKDPCDDSNDDVDRCNRSHVLRDLMNEM